MGAQIEIRTEVESQVLADATAVYAEACLTLSEAFRLMLVRAAREHALPFDPFIPNEETVAAMLEARHGKLKSFKTVEELMADLNADD